MYIVPSIYINMYIYIYIHTNTHTHTKTCAWSVIPPYDTCSDASFCMRWNCSGVSFCRSKCVAEATLQRWIPQAKTCHHFLVFCEVLYLFSLRVVSVCCLKHSNAKPYHNINCSSNIPRCPRCFFGFRSVSLFSKFFRAILQKVKQHAQSISVHKGLKIQDACNSALISCLVCLVCLTQPV